MEKNFRINFQVQTEVPPEFFFSFFLSSITGSDFTTPLSNISVLVLNFLSGTRKLEDESEFRNYRFMSIAQHLRDMPFDTDRFAKLSDKEFAQEMRIRFEKAKIHTRTQIITLFSPGKDESVFEVYQDFLVSWSVPVFGKKEKTRETKREIVSVPVGYCIV